MTERTLRDRIAALLVHPTRDQDDMIYNLAIGDALAAIDAHTAAQPAPAHIAAAACTCGHCGGLVCCQNCGTPPQPAPDAVAEADAFDAFAQWFRKNYPGPDTIIHKPDWHSQRIFRAVKHALAKGHQP